MYLCNADVVSDTLLQNKSIIKEVNNNLMIAMPTIHITPYNHLILNDLRGGICCGIASSATYSIMHRAFRRCQTMAQAEGFVRFRPPDADRMANST